MLVPHRQLRARRIGNLQPCCLLKALGLDVTVNLTPWGPATRGRAFFRSKN